MLGRESGVAGSSPACIDVCGDCAPVKDGTGMG